MTQFHSRVRTRITFRLPGGIPVNNDFGGGERRRDDEQGVEREREKENRLKPIIPPDSRGKKKVGGEGEGGRNGFSR